MKSYNQLKGIYETPIQINDDLSNRLRNAPQPNQNINRFNKNMLPLIEPPPLKLNLSPIEELRNEFLKQNPDIKHESTFYYKKINEKSEGIDGRGKRYESIGCEKWFYFVRDSLIKIQERCKNRLILPSAPIREPPGANGLSGYKINYWDGGDVWRPDYTSRINSIEAYYTECREFEINSYINKLKQSKIDEENRLKQFKINEENKLKQTQIDNEIINKYINKIIELSNNYLNIDESRAIITMFAYEESQDKKKAFWDTRLKYTFHDLQKYFNSTNGNTLLALQVINKFALENKIRVEDSITIFREYMKKLN